MTDTTKYTEEYMKKFVEQTAQATPTPTIPTPTKPGYVFSHWSIVKPGATTQIRTAEGSTIAFKENDCPPFDFAHEQISEDTTLYAVFIPEVHITFMSDDVELQKQTTLRGGRAYNPVSCSPLNNDMVCTRHDDVIHCHR